MKAYKKETFASKMNFKGLTQVGCNMALPDPLVSRRAFLRSSALGFGSLALAGLCAGQARAALSPLAPRMPQFNGRAKRVIFLYMWGGPSQMDLFDPKPRL